MKGTLYHIAPPGFVTVAQACNVLGMNRANFHAKGYADALDRWQVSQSTTLYRAQDVADMVRWQVVRRGMIALGHWSHNTPGVPTDGEFHAAIHEGYWDVDCPKCGGDGVGDPLGDKVWCPECDK